MLWSFSPFVTAQKRFYTAVLFSRLLMVLVSEYTVFDRLFLDNSLIHCVLCCCSRSLALVFSLQHAYDRTTCCRLKVSVLMTSRNSTHQPSMSDSLDIQHPYVVSEPCSLSLTQVPLYVHAVCQTLRILSFSSTQLPSPNYHCRLPELTAIKDMPLHWWGHFIVDLGRQASLLL